MGKVKTKFLDATLPILPRLLDVHLAAIYLSVGEQTIRDWITDGILSAIAMPGSTLRDRHGHINARPGERNIAKILIDRKDIDALIETRKTRHQ